MQSVVELWNRAQRLEAAGSRAQARAAYEEILAVEPYHVPARLRMSRLDQFADDYAASKQHALAAADAVQLYANTRNMGFATARLLEFAEEERVAAIIQGANTADPNVIRQSPSLAQHLWLTGRYAETLQFLDAVTASVGAHALLTYTRANVLRYLGDMEGAEREYEACIAIAPDFADAHWALATHSKAKTPAERVPRIRSALTRTSEGSVEQAHLLYALFRELEAAGDIDAAWSALAQGMDVMSKRLKFDSRVEAAKFASLTQITPLEASPVDGATPTPIFIVGMPRTGTTLLDRILSNHDAVKSLGERNDFAAAISEASGRFFRSALVGDLHATLVQTNFEKAGALYLERVRRLAPDARYVIDKNPQNLFNIPLILRALPHARILCMRREPMDACFSNLKELFQGDAYPYSYSLSDVADHYLRADEWMLHWQHIREYSVRVVSYERLVASAELETGSVLDFIGLEPQPGLHEITRNDEPVSTASSSQVREAIHQRGVEAWRRYEQHLGPLKSRFIA